MLRRIISKFNRSVSKRVVSFRRKYEVPIKLSFAPTEGAGKIQIPHKEVSIIGETKDLSKTGIALVVPAIRVREFYLVGEGRTLNAEMDLPSGNVKMQIVGQRYEQIGEHISTSRYLIGARITFMTDDNREAYETFLRYGKTKTKSAGSLKLGVDES